MRRTIVLNNVRNNYKIGPRWWRLIPNRKKRKYLSLSLRTSACSVFVWGGGRAGLEEFSRYSFSKCVGIGKLLPFCWHLFDSSFIRYTRGDSANPPFFSTIQMNVFKFWFSEFLSLFLGTNVQSVPYHLQKIYHLVDS